MPEENKEVSDDITISTERRRAAALKYSMETDMAPRVVAKGERLVAERILALAKTHGIPVKEDPDLVALLMELELNATIPPELYRAVAEIFAWLYRIQRVQPRSEKQGE
jgi:flagellar biosynthesis protein